MGCQAESLLPFLGCQSQCDGLPDHHSLPQCPADTNIFITKEYVIQESRSTVLSSTLTKGNIGVAGDF